jgi:hypothetical protein
MEQFLVQLVMAGLVPAIHVLASSDPEKAWMSGTRPGMTKIMKSARSAKAPLRGWQDTIAGRAPVQRPATLPHWMPPE